MAKTLPPGGVALLDVEESADLLGISETRFRFLERRGFIQPLATPVGPRYREDLLKELHAAIGPATGYAGAIRVSEAAHILGVNTRTVRNAADAGLLHRDARGRYDAAEVYALRQERGEGKLLRPVQPPPPRTRQGT